MAAGKKLTYEYVKGFFENNGCVLLEPEYKNARTKMRYRCSCGEESQIVFDSFRVGNRCWKCGCKKIAGSLTASHKEVEDYYKSQGCELLDIYTRSSIPVKYRCVCGNIAKGNFNNFKRGCRCKICLSRKRSGPNNYQWIVNREAKRKYGLFKQRCYKLLKRTLKSTNQKKCNRTHVMLGYTPAALQKHIASFPDWDKLKMDRWHIDHIFPIKAFVDFGIKDLRVINALDNLRPITVFENISKSDDYNVEEFKDWLDKKGCKICR